ncbi:hypothetical protein E1A91_D12G212600v1 [Gossypium mustelinum]|uniref:Uncharacterized protein n=2 Tax=Gossypium TaxID=3633 RepID=A0A5D2SI07_GOSMU|nr:hypothetical protein E1A91_D12G212600v1 [Gossypium mustelinum]
MSREKLRRAALPPVQKILMQFEQDQKETKDILLKCFSKQMLYVIFPVPSLLLASTFMLMQEKYEKAIAALAEMEKRAVMAESMEEGTLHYHSGQNKAQPSFSPRCVVDFPLSNLLCLGEKHLIMDDKTKPDQLVQLILQRTW